MPDKELGSLTGGKSLGSAKQLTKAEHEMGKNVSLTFNSTRSSL